MRKNLVLVSLLVFAMPLFGALSLPRPVIAEAEGPDGAIVGFSVTVVGGNDGSDGRPADVVTCSPAPLSLFPLGTTTVSCSGSEGSTGSFTVTVVDMTGPVLQLPRDFSVVSTSPSGTSVTYTAVATDLVAGSVSVSCSPASGSTFAIGTTTVTCSATDHYSNTSTGTFHITVSTSPVPPVQDVTAEATGPDGAHVTFDTGSGDDGDGRPGSGGCSPAPGSLFPLGTTLVTCTTGNFNVKVVDTTGPALSLPGDITEGATSPGGATVNYTASANDLVDGAVAVNCVPSSGTFFSIGTTAVSCSASDSRGNTSHGGFNVTVTTGAPPPHSDITAEATSAAGAVVTYAPVVDGDGHAVSCAPASGSTFPLGSTTVTCSNGSTFVVTVVDTTPPALSLPGSMTLNATSPAGATATFTATASDIVDGSVPVNCTPSSGTTFPLGSTSVTCTATDAHGNSSSGGFTITVADLEAPHIVSISVSPSTIWPPDNKLVDVTVTVVATDNVDSSLQIDIYSITCNESLKAGDTAITGPLTAKVRADRDGKGTGRVYTLWIEVVDDAGNRTVSSVTVSVPHDQAPSGSLTVIPPSRRRTSGG